MIYIDGDTLENYREAVKQGLTIVDLADRLGIEAVFLSRLLGIPMTPMPTTAASQPQDDSSYLWRAEELDNVL